MKLTSTGTSTSIHDLIVAADPTAIEKIESKVIKGWNFGNYWVELQFISDVITIETILDDAVVWEWRTLDANTPLFAFNTDDLRNIKIIWSWDFYITIV